MSLDATPSPSFNASDPAATYVNVSCLDLLLIEMVPLAERMARRAERLERGGGEDGDREEREEEEERGFTAKSNKARAMRKREGGGGGGRGLESSNNDSSGGGSGSTGGSDGGGEVYRDAIFLRLDRLGYRVGQGLSERFSRDRPRFIDSLDVIKFLCKDLWIILFKKQIDNLKTNHRGIYVLTDSKFRPFMRMSLPNNPTTNSNNNNTRNEATDKAQPHLLFPCGIVRGALSSLGIPATVQAQVTDLPAAMFEIKMLS